VADGRVGEERGDARGAGRLYGDPQGMPQQLHRLDEGAVVDHDHVVDDLGHCVDGGGDGLAHGDPVSDRHRRWAGYRPAGTPGVGHGGRASGARRTTRVWG
jgi:hypothetical protein